MGVFVACAHCDHIRLNGQAGGAPAPGSRRGREVEGGQDVGWEDHPRPGTALGPTSRVGRTPRALSWFSQAEAEVLGPGPLASVAKQGRADRTPRMWYIGARGIVHTAVCLCGCVPTLRVRTGLGNADIGQLTLDPSPQDRCPTPQVLPPREA